MILIKYKHMRIILCYNSVAVHIISFRDRVLNITAGSIVEYKRLSLLLVFLFIFFR